MVITGSPSQSVRHSLASNAGIAKKLPTSQIMKRNRKDEQTHISGMGQQELPSSQGRTRSCSCLFTIIMLFHEMDVMLGA